jgi:hypothetical protein
MNLAATVASSDLAKRYLAKDAINRMMGRYFQVSVNSDLKDQHVYNYYIRKKLGLSLFKYLLLTDLPIKTRVSFVLMLSNLKNLQLYLHKHLGKK